MVSNKLVVGNWKMNGSLASNRVLVEALKQGVPVGVDSALCVPFPYLAQVAQLLADSPIALGAQDASACQEGAYTGQVSATMLNDFGCEYVIVGHSERRAQLGESDTLVAAKASAVLASGMTPIVCVGETLEEREGDRVEAVLGRQLDALIHALAPASLQKLVIAYEPVWAIGSGRAATAAQVQEVLAFVRAALGTKVSRPASLRILYGGSVKADSAEGLFGLPDADGGLIGGASLVAEEFIAICRAAVSASQGV